MSCHKINPKADSGVSGAQNCIICEQSEARPIRLSKAKITQKTITHLSDTLQSKPYFPTTILQLLIASVAVVVALLGLCAGDVSHINHELPKDIVVPFNDLLPPPLEESTTEAPNRATAAVVATTVVSKPTKKSYYQQQARSKDAQPASEKSSSNKVAVPQLALDLLPPFEVLATSDAVHQEDQDKRTTTQRTLITSPATAITERSVPRYVVQPQVAHARVSRPNSIASEASASSTTPVKTNALTPALIAQYASYFQFSTPRPPRGPLPTLTPFPHHRKL